LPTELEIKNWIRERMRQARLKSSQAYVKTLKMSLPQGARENIRATPDGVTGEVSHGLTTEGMRRAAKAAIKLAISEMDSLINDFDKQFGDDDAG